MSEVCVNGFAGVHRERQRILGVGSIATPIKEGLAGVGGCFAAGRSMDVLRTAPADLLVTRYKLTHIAGRLRPQYSVDRQRH